MAYKISGFTAENSRIIVLKESDWSVETTQSGIVGSFDITALTSGKKTVVVRNDLGKIAAVGKVSSIEAFTSGDRGVFGGGFGGINVIDYITISVTGNATDFGDLVTGRNPGGKGSNGGLNTGIFAGGNPNSIDTININSAADATDFGDLTANRSIAGSADSGTDDKLVIAGGYANVSTMEHLTPSVPGDAALTGGNLTTGRNSMAGLSNDTNGRGVYVGGVAISAGYPSLNVIDYVTISSTSNAASFGGIGTVRRSHMSGTSNGVNDRGVSLQGYNYSGGNIFYNNIDYLTITSLGNSQDFGDLSLYGQTPGVVSNKTNERGVSSDGYVSNNVIEYITISSTGNGTDFGDLTVARSHIRGISNA